MEPNQNYHILVVEDDKEIREGIEIYLRNQGYRRQWPRGTCGHRRK